MVVAPHLNGSGNYIINSMTKSLNVDWLRGVKLYLYILLYKNTNVFICKYMLNVVVTNWGYGHLLVIL